MPHYRYKGRGIKSLSRDEQIERIWSLIEKTETCWIWHGLRDHAGYGRVVLDGKRWRVHRLLFSWKIGHDSTLFILHHCDNPPCCNPAHLYEGTPADNSHDMVVRGRSLVGDRNHSKWIAKTKGEQCPWSKLKNQQVIEIRTLRSTALSCEAIARKFNVWPGTIRQIISGRTWTHL